MGIGLHHPGIEGQPAEWAAAARLQVGPLLLLAVRADHPRAMAAADVAEAFQRLGIPTEVVDNVSAALGQALAEAGSSGVICLTGSLFVAAEAREHLGLGKKERI